MHRDHGLAYKENCTSAHGLYLDKYFKFVFVREPYHRLLSAYFSKVLTNTASITKPNATKNNNETVTFSEFLEYAVSDVERPDPHDHIFAYEHWELYSKLINFCDQEFDFIGKYEDFSEDVRHVLSHLFPHITFEFPQRNVIRKEKTAADYYSEVDQAIIRRVAKAYADDFELFGYDPNLYLK